jgi:hypothetical protein
MWKHWRFITLWASTTCYRDSFTVLPLPCQREEMQIKYWGKDFFSLLGYNTVSFRVEEAGSMIFWNVDIYQTTRRYILNDRRPLRWKAGCSSETFISNGLHGVMLQKTINSEYSGSRFFWVLNINLQNYTASHPRLRLSWDLAFCHKKEETEENRWLKKVTGSFWLWIR